MRLSNRDLLFLNFVNRFGRIEKDVLVELVFHNLKTSSWQTSYSRTLKKLKDVKAVKVFDWINGNKVIVLDKNSKHILEFFEFDFLGSSNTSLSTMRHDLLVSRVFLQIWRKKKDINFFTDREVRKSKIYESHYPDLTIINEEKGNSIVEIELNKKSKSYYENRFRFFENFNFRNILYLTPKKSLEEYIYDSSILFGKNYFIFKNLDSFFNEEQKNE